jgi:hypothetical protein
VKVGSWRGEGESFDSPAISKLQVAATVGFRPAQL